MKRWVTLLLGVLLVTLITVFLFTQPTVSDLMDLPPPTTSSLSSTMGNFLEGAKSKVMSGLGPRKPGKPIMGKMGNETIKAELGRSAWRLLHTMAAKFPIEPTPDQRQALADFIYLFARLYPCGECAAHFSLILEKHPPVVTDREAISKWACHVHNLVNERLDKPKFDCSQVGEMWKCGCDGEEEEEAKRKSP